MFILHHSGAIGLLAVQLTALGVVPVGLLLHFVFWRCPSCRSYLQASFFDSYCARCGALLLKTD